MPRFSFPDSLPISAHVEEITAALRDNQVIIVSGDTGSGKTTQLPKICLLAGRGKRGLIGITQPRRLACLAMARRVAEEFGEEVGSSVGYQHRFDRKTSRATVVKFMTDGILLAETRTDRLFRAYDTLIIDEAHERSLNIDFLLGILHRTLPRRPDLKLIISSATLDVGRFSEFFHHAPVISVPGRLFPIETRWRPAEDEDDADLPRQIANAVDELIAEGEGDILVFLPGERDIREAQEVLTGRRLPHTEIIPLLASLPAGEQQRAFRLSPNRRIILSTNVAETSVTIPGIRYVVDSGLARINRYNPRTHVQRLQVEPISQASANQRQGRCGRVAPGVCIRLYSAEDYRRRDAFTPPEILRSSLAGVILSMLDLRLGDIATFPFLDAPSQASIKDGYAELYVLGALERKTNGRPSEDSDEPPRLTPLGRQLARLPLDPAYARILFAAADEGVLEEVLIIVSFLECDDPRRRPIDKREEADQLHARFLNPVSDFLAILKLWHWYHDPELQNRLRPGGPLRNFDAPAQQSQSALRRLCQSNFLSFPKMRDWCDLRDQLAQLCRELGLRNASRSGDELPDAAIHRALLTGLVTSIGKRDEEASDYRGTRSIRFALFPGSGLAKCKSPKNGGEREPNRRPPRPPKGSLPASRDWILAADLVETSRLFARTAACIDPEWIEPIARPICKYSYHSPEWDAERGFVRIQERVTLLGLVLTEGRPRDDSRIHPEEARELFIRHGLVAGEFPRPVPPCLVANRNRIEALLSAEEKLRRHGALFDPDAAFAFYDERIPAEVSSANALRRWLSQNTAEARCLVMTDTDLPPAKDLAAEFPDSVVLNGHRFRLTYRHTPDAEDDGVTCTVPAHWLPTVAAWRSDWLVPGLVDEKLHWMLTALPSKLRRLLVPLPDTIARLKSRLEPGREPLFDAVSRVLYESEGIRVPSGTWREDDLPPHLRMRFEVTEKEGDKGEKVIGNGRNIALLTKLFAPDQAHPVTHVTIGGNSRGAYFRDHISSWDFGDLPATVQTGQTGGWNVTHTPALVANADGSISLRLFADPEEAAISHEAGLCRLYELALGYEWQNLAQPPRLTLAATRFLQTLETTPAQLGVQIARAAIHDAFLANRPAIRTRAEFLHRLGRDTDGRQSVPTPAPKREKTQPKQRWNSFSDLELAVNRSSAHAGTAATAGNGIARLQSLRTERARLTATLLQEAAAIEAELANPASTHSGGGRAKGLSELSHLLTAGGLPNAVRDDLTEQLAWLFFPRFAETLTCERLREYPRYLHAIRIRMERCRSNPAGEQRKQEQVRPYWERYTEFFATDPLPRHNAAALDEYRWLVEEYRVSLFAQELRTPVPVSPKRLDTLWDSVRV
ncbi:MAG: ATP-dependent RNA helicase HrpA [Kiritimatiellae bacterium]|nr:ATP-dependent RNA helicase HrpA [Kiritimatiellia bacterium]